jgi:5'-3' exonuclease
MVVFCLDGTPKYRLSLHPEYKAGRRRHEPEPDALPVYPYELLYEDIRLASRLYNTPVFFACSPYREADDVIAAIVRGTDSVTDEAIADDSRLSNYFPQQVWVRGVLSIDDVCIMSSDSDLQQLITVTDTLKVGTVSKMSLVDVTYEVSDSFKKKDVNSPAELLAYKIFEGDTGDNIPRCRVMPPRKCGNLFWKTLNTEDKLIQFVCKQSTFPELIPMIDVEKLHLNTHLIYLHSAAYPLATPYFYQL